MLFVTIVHFCGSSSSALILLLSTFVDRALCFLFCPLLWIEQYCSNLLLSTLVDRALCFLLLLSTFVDRAVLL